MHGKKLNVLGPRGLTFMITMAITAADIVNMMAGNSMTTAAPTLVWKNPIAASQPLQGKERVWAPAYLPGKGPLPFLCTEL